MSSYAVVVGSLNIDLVIQGDRMPEKGESILGNSFNTFPGGKGANQAVQLARLGLEAYMVGRVGNDVFADQLISSLTEAGVRTDYLIQDESAGTGKGWVLVDKAGDNYIIVIPEANMKWQASELEPLGQLIAGASVVLAQLEIPVPVVETIIQQAAQAQVMTVLNPSPAFALPASLFRQVDVLVLNRNEADFYLGANDNDAGSVIDKARKLLQKTGVGTVVLTLGEDGVVAVDEKQTYEFPAYSVSVVDVTAAGDSFCSSLVYGLTIGESLHTALQFACASGAIAVSRQGAQPSLPKLSEVKAFILTGGQPDG